MLYADWFASATPLSQADRGKRGIRTGCAKWSILIQKEQGRTMWILAPTNEHGEPLAWDAYDGARLGYVLRQAR